jgi:hypothetical protein
MPGIIAITLIDNWDIASAELTAELFMKHIIYENGICIEIVSDRDSKFTSKMWQDFHAVLGQLVGPIRPQA